MAFTEKIEKLLAANHIKEVIEEFLKFLNEVPHSKTDAKSDAGELRGQIIVISGRFTDLSTKVNMNTVNADSANHERASIVQSFIQILNQLPSSYPDLNTYMEEKNEDDDWKDAQNKNSIEGYHIYFNKYPNGKYKADTIKLIAELEEVKLKQDNEIKRLALLEKERRENDKLAGEAQKQPAGPLAYSSTPAVSAPPAKSKKGLYIGLGAGALVLLFIIVLSTNSTPAVSEGAAITNAAAENHSDSNAVKAELRLAFESALQAEARALVSGNKNDLTESFEGEALKSVHKQIEQLLENFANMKIEIEATDIVYKTITVTGDGQKGELFAEFKQAALITNPATSACAQIPSFQTSERAFFNRTQNGWKVSSYIEGNETPPDPVPCKTGAN